MDRIIIIKHPESSYSGNRITRTSEHRLERAADKLENLEAERGTASGNECLCVADIRLFFILQNTMCGIQGNRSRSIS